MTTPQYAFQRVTRKRRCAICGKQDYCGYDPRACIAACSRTPSERPYGAWGWLHTVTASTHEYDASAVREQTQRKPLDAWEAAGRDLLYHHMAGQRHCVLTPGDRSGLHQRGLDDVTIRRRGYFTFPTKAQVGDVAHQVNAYAERGTDARRYLGTHGHALASVWWALPGVYAKGHRNGRGVATLIGGPSQGALALPVRNVDGQIVALHLRLRDGEMGPDEKRYKWHSGKNPSGAPCHIARPSGAHDHARVIITEGELKADIASDRLGCIVVAVPGVDVYRDVPGILDDLRSRGDLDADARVIVAHDSDAATKPAVASARDRLANLLTQPPRSDRVTLATWDTQYQRTR